MPDVCCKTHHFQCLQTCPEVSRHLCPARDKCVSQHFYIISVSHNLTRMFWCLRSDFENKYHPFICSSFIFSLSRLKLMMASRLIRQEMWSIRLARTMALSASAKTRLMVSVATTGFASFVESWVCSLCYCQCLFVSMVCAWICAWKCLFLKNGM